MKYLTDGNNQEWPPSISEGNHSKKREKVGETKQHTISAFRTSAFMYPGFLLQALRTTDGTSSSVRVE